MISAHFYADLAQPRYARITAMHEPILTEPTPHPLMRWTPYCLCGARLTDSGLCFTCTRVMGYDADPDDIGLGYSGEDAEC